jgi:acetyl esterase/lipase
MDRRQEIRLYDDQAPGSEDWSHEERAFYSDVFATDVVTNVVVPTLTPVMPERECGTGIIVAPGGGYHALSINSEGYDVARWLAERGLAAFVLKYRLVPGGDELVGGPVAENEVAGNDVDGNEVDGNEVDGNEVDGNDVDAGEPDRDVAFDDMQRIAPLAAADAAAAVRLVRSRADEFDVGPTRLGLMGFSAGGNVALRVAFTHEARSRPDFLAAIYAPVFGVELDDPPAGSGPVFVVAATDDELGLAADSVAIYECWRSARLPAELHMYARGGHGFGMRTQRLPSDTWIDRFGDWLAAIEMM